MRDFPCSSSPPSVFSLPFYSLHYNWFVSSGKGRLSSYCTKHLISFLFLFFRIHCFRDCLSKCLNVSLTVCFSLVSCAGLNSEHMRTNKHKRSEILNFLIKAINAKHCCPRNLFYQPLHLSPPSFLHLYTSLCINI